MSTAPGSVHLGKLRWHCRRGMKELDVLLERYLEEEYCGSPPELQEAFHRLLQAPDPEIYAWCMGGQAAPSAVMATLIGRLTAPRRPLLESKVCATSP